MSGNSPPSEELFWRLLPLFYALPFLVTLRGRPVLAVFCAAGCAAGHAWAMRRFGNCALSAEPWPAIGVFLGAVVSWLGGRLGLPGAWPEGGAFAAFHILGRASAALILGHVGFFALAAVGEAWQARRGGGES